MKETELDYPPPDPRPNPPHFTAPANSCDCHAHVIGPADKYPFVFDRSYTPPDALLPEYLNVLRVLGLQRAVLVQPSMHGTDNTAMMDAIREATSFDLRAIVVVPPNVTEKELATLHRNGARGVRLNLIYRGGGVGVDAASEMAARVRDFGWHLQILADVSQLGGELIKLSGLPAPLVFDHMGHLAATKGIQDKGFAALLELVRRGNTWVKLSGAYRLTAEKFPYADVQPLADALLKTSTERMLWGTDWPHTLCRAEMPNDGDLLDLLRQWVRDDLLLQKILVENPAEVYSF